MRKTSKEGVTEAASTAKELAECVIIEVIDSMPKKGKSPKKGVPDEEPKDATDEKKTEKETVAKETKAKEDEKEPEPPKGKTEMPPNEYYMRPPYGYPSYPTPPTAGHFMPPSGKGDKGEETKGPQADLNMPPLHAGMHPQFPPPYGYGPPPPYGMVPLPYYPAPGSPYGAPMPPHWPPSGPSPYAGMPPPFVPPDASPRAYPPPPQGAFEDARFKAVAEDGQESMNGEETEMRSPAGHAKLYVKSKAKLPKKHKDLREKKNSQSRRRAAALRERVKAISDKPENDRTQEEKELLASYEEKRAKKNNRSRVRAVEKNQEATRILEKPEEERTETEREFIHSYLTTKAIKNKGDRDRRMRNKMAKKGVLGNFQAKQQKDEWYQQQDTLPPDLQSPWPGAAV